MKLNRIFVLAVILAFTSGGSVLAVLSSDKVGTTSAQFLKLGIGARPLAMGEAFTAVSDDVNAVYWNPAGLGQIQGREAGAMHAIWFQDISFSWLAYSQKTLGGTMGASVKYLSAGDMDYYDNTGLGLDDTYTARDMMFTASYARKIKGWPLGMNLKVISSKLEEESAFGIAADIGTLKTVSKSREIKVGLVVQNLGMGLKFVDDRDPLPINVKIGSYYRLLSEQLLLAADINLPADNRISFHTGAEYSNSIGPVQIMPRAGFKTTTISDLDMLSGLSAGVGFGYRDLCVDYAWVPYGDLGSTHRISLGYKFGTLDSEVAPRLSRSERLYRSGLRELETGNYLEAIDIFTRVLIMDPYHEGALKSLDKASGKLE